MIRWLASHRTFMTLAVIAASTFIALPVAGFVAWWAQPERDLQLLVFNGTGGERGVDEHRSVGLMLDYWKIPYDWRSDYVGSAADGSSHGQWPTERPDLVFLIDAYGVYTDADGAIDDEGRTRISEAFPAEFARDIADWTRQGTLVYGEFNIMHEPTSPAAASTLQQVFGVVPTGWTGRYLDDLADAPPGITDLHAGSWPHRGPGIVLAGPGRDGVQLVVLESHHLVGGPPAISGDLLDRGREVESDFRAWFALVDADPPARTHMWLELPVNDAGAALLSEHGAPRRAPFVVSTDQSFYVAGNAAATDADFPARRIKGSLAVLERLPYEGDSRSFYRIYAPILDEMLTRQVGE